MSEVALLGGIYSNHLALEAALADIARRGIQGIHCLGDLGGFGPHPDRVFGLLREAGVRCIQGNYDFSVGNGLDDCGCGYTDPRDNHYAQISYDYTFARTSPANREWLAALPSAARFQLGAHRVLLCHGSPRRINEFLWESGTPDALLERFLREQDADVLAFTHTGIKWKRELPGGKLAVNVGVLGRPENDGTARVWYTILRGGSGPEAEFVPVSYDHETLAREMEAESLPPEFISTIREGWWTTCLEVMPSLERARGRF